MFNKHFLALVLHCVYNIKTTRKTRSIIKYTFKITYSFSKPAFYLNSSHTFAEMLIVLVSLVVCVSSKSLRKYRNHFASFPKYFQFTAPEIQKCRKFDPKLGECLAEKVVDSMHRFKQGNKELGIVPLEPLVIQKLEFGNSGDGPVAIQQVYENLKLFGITAFTIYDSECVLNNTIFSNVVTLLTILGPISVTKTATGGSKATEILSEWKPIIK